VDTELLFILSCIRNIHGKKDCEGDENMLWETVLKFIRVKNGVWLSEQCSFCFVG
jgi:hypothetical protein